MPYLRTINIDNSEVINGFLLGLNSPESNPYFPNIPSMQVRIGNDFSNSQITANYSGTGSKKFHLVSNADYIRIDAEPLSPVNTENLILRYLFKPGNVVQSPVLVLKKTLALSSHLVLITSEIKQFETQLIGKGKFELACQHSFALNRAIMMNNFYQFLTVKNRSRLVISDRNGSLKTYRFDPDGKVRLI